jgi:hypothetical protein
MVRRLLAGCALVCGSLVFVPVHAADAAPAHVNGKCQGSGTFKSNGMKVLASEEGTVTVPVKDDVAWEASITGAEGNQPYSGDIEVDMPWPFAAVSIDSWKGTTDSPSNSNVKHYDLPWFTPRGVEMQVTGSHTQGPLSCDGHVTIKVAGGAFKSPGTPAAVIGTVLTGGLLALAGRAKGGSLA